MQHIFQRRGGVIVQKMLLVIVSCMVICGFAYRWGDAKWEDAKITAIENLYSGISEVIFPQIYAYEYDKKSLIYQDVEQVFMPVVSSFRSSGTRTSSGFGVNDIGQDSDGQLPEDDIGEEVNQQNEPGYTEENLGDSQDAIQSEGGMNYRILIICVRISIR